MTTEATRLQERVILGAEKSLAAGRNAMIDAPTGAGKSRMFSRVAENGHLRGERTLILSHRQNLAKQALKNVQRWTGADIDTSLGIDGKLDQSGQVVSTTIQTANANLDKIEAYDRAVFDEGHHAMKGNSDYENIIDALKKANPNISIVAVSATLPDDRSRLIDDLAKADVHSITFEDALNARLIDLPRTATPPEMLANNMTVADIVQEHRGKNKGADIDGIGAEIGRNLPENWNETMAWHYAKNFDQVPTLSFFDTVKEAEDFAKEVREFGIEIETLHSGKGKNANADILENFETGKLKGIASVDMISEGFDVDAKGLFLGKKTTSLREYKQIIGRGSRSYGEDKAEKALLLDMGASTLMHGEITAQAAANNLRKAIDGKSMAPEIAPESEKARAIWKPIDGTKAYAAPIGDRVVYALPSPNGYIAMASSTDRKGARLNLLEIDGQRRGQPSREAFIEWSTEAIRGSERSLARIMSSKGGVDAVIEADWKRNGPSVQKNIELLSANLAAQQQAMQMNASRGI